MQYSSQKAGPVLFKLEAADIPQSHKRAFLIPLKIFESILLPNLWQLPRHRKLKDKSLEGVNDSSPLLPINFNIN